MKTSLSIFFLLFSVVVYGQTILVVDNNPGTAADYSDLQEAADAANPGDFIYVVPSSESYGNLDINKELHVRGMGHFPLGTNDLNSYLNSITFQNDCGNSSVSGIRGFNSFWSEANNSGFNDNVTISNCHFRQLKIGGNNWVVEGNIINNVGSNSNAIWFDLHANTTVHHNFIRHQDSDVESAFRQAPETTLEYNNIYVLDAGRLLYQCTNVEFQNSIILSLEEGDNLTFDGSSGWSFNNCLSFNYNGFSVPLTGGDNNLEDTDPLFENIQNDSPAFQYGNNYNPAAGSPLINAASDGDNIGIYNDNFDFDQRGHAIDLPYITALDILNPSVEEGEDLEIEFSAFGN